MDMEQREFVKIIQKCQRRLNIAGFLNKLISTLHVGAVIGIFFLALSFVTPLYYAGLYTVLALLFTLIIASVMAYVKRTSMEQAALVMDSFGFDERIVTAYGNLGKEGALVELQRVDAMRQLQAHQDKIRITLLPPWKKMATLAGLFVALIVLALVPSAMKERAKELHSVKEEAREKTEEIEEVMEALEELAKEEALTPEQQAQLQEMMESLEASLSEYQQVTTNEMMRAASEKLEYRYGNMGSQLASLAQNLKNGAAVSPVTEESMQALAEKMQEMSGSQLAMQGTGGQDGDNGNGQGSQGSQNGQGNQNGSGQDGQGGQNGNGQSSQGGQNGNGQDGQGGQSGDQGGSGDGGSGNGRGTGSSSTAHDYVSIPNDIADSGNLMRNAVDHDDSDYFHAQNGLSWEGTHMSHEAVIGSYEQNAYEGIAAGKYPSGMEEVIKEYFSSFND